jgi:peptidoglycan/LPS O-acetylase OafA/YrhL
MLPSLVPESPLKAEQTYFPALTDVRALAVGLVFFFHTCRGLQPTLLVRFFQQGAAGVSTFFVLSGFLIAIRY